MKPVGQVAVVAVVGQVGGEHLPAILLERPDAVVGRLAWPEVRDPQADPVERDEVAVGDGLVGKRAHGRPFVADHWPQNRLFERIVAADDSRDTGGGEHGHRAVAGELDEAAVVIGMGVRDDEAEQGFAKLGHPRS
jgi:hypothetical protein